MKVSCLIPFRDADGTRTRAKDWILARWKHHYPDWEFIVASDDGVDPFNKSMAVNKAAAQATGDVFVILDADTWIDPLFMARAFRQLDIGQPWVMPANRHLRLRKDVSEQLMALDPTGPLSPISMRQAETSGVTVGFLWVVPRKAFEAVGGMDERIRGWGGEDTMFIRAMDVVNGRHKKISGTVMCLWHDRPKDAVGRVWLGQDRAMDKAKQELASRYTHARRPEEMLAVLNVR